jgi:mRNA deadenylase 3'-5' endonuclease subunit Ccr4
MPFTAATYNVLATAYLGRGDYSLVPPDLLEPARRTKALARHVVDLGADVLCLQEVEVEVFRALRKKLGRLGYEGHLELKGRDKPDGCATFYRTEIFSLQKMVRLDYHDNVRGPGQHSGFLALLLALEHEKKLLGVANTHLRWDRPGTPANRQTGHLQAVELIDTCESFTPSCNGWLVCGDFNRRPDSEVVATFKKNGFELAHSGRSHVRSAVINGRASLLDYLFFTEELLAEPVDPPRVSPFRELPSAEQPSDHLPLLAEFQWAADG